MFVIFIKIEHRNLETRKTLTTSQFRYETFYYLCVERFFDIRRDIHILPILAFSSAPTPTLSCGTRHKGHCSGFGERAKVNPLLPRQDSTQLTDFFKIPKILRARFRCMTSFTSTGQPFYRIFILISMNDTSSPRAR